MEKTVYDNKRKELVTEAQNFINASNLEDYNRIEEEIKNLDKQFEEEAKAQANLDALNNIVNAANVQTITPIAGTIAIDPLNLDNSIVDTDLENKKNEDLYINAWAKDMMNKPLTEEERAIFDAKNEAFTHTTENTGIVIPTTVMDGIWKEVGEQYPLWNDVLKTGIKGNVEILKSTGSSKANWYDEETKTEDGKETFAKGMLTGCELARSIAISWKLREMSIKEFIPFVQSQLAEQIGAALGYGVALGKGKPSESDSFKPEPRGIITALKAESGTPQIIEYDDANPLEYKTCTSALACIKSAYIKGASVYADNATIWNEIANITDKTGKPFFVPDPTSGGVGRMLGIVVKEDDSIPTGDILVGNANAGYHANINKQVSLDSEDRKKDRETDYLAYGIVDGDIRTSKAFAYITKNISAE